MLKTINRVVLTVVVVGISLPLLYFVGVIGLIAIDLYKGEKRAQQVALERHYQSVYIGRERVSLLSPPKPLPATDRLPHATIEVMWYMESGELTSPARRRKLQIEAPLYAERECEALLRAIASSCVMKGATVSSSSSNFVLRMELEFVQKRDISEVAAAKQRDLALVQVDYRNQNHANPRAGTDSVYAQIESDCDKSIAVESPYKIDRIHLHTYVAEQNGQVIRVSTRGSADFLLVRKKEERASSPMPSDNAHEQG